MIKVLSFKTQSTVYRGLGVIVVRFHFGVYFSKVVAVSNPHKIKNPFVNLQSFSCRGFSFWLIFAAFSPAGTDSSTEGDDGRGRSQDCSGQLWTGMLLHSEDGCGEGRSWNGQETRHSKIIWKPSVPAVLPVFTRFFCFSCCLFFSFLFSPFLSQEFELRKHARQEGRRYCDPVVLTYQAERMPEQIRLKVHLIEFSPAIHFLTFLEKAGFLTFRSLTDIVSTAGRRGRPEAVGSLWRICQERSRVLAQQRSVSAHWLPGSADEGEPSCPWFLKLATSKRSRVQWMSQYWS